MSFSFDCKEELCRLPLEKSCCTFSELGALYMTLGSLNLLGRGQVNVQFTIDSATIAKRVFTLLQREIHLTAQIHYVTHPRFGGIRKYVLTLGPHQSPTFLARFSMMALDPLGQPVLLGTAPKMALQRSCCMRSFLRGVMLGCGTLTRPERGYRLTLAAREESLQALIAKCLHRFDLPVRQRPGKNTVLFYQTKGEHVITFLTLIGAHQAVMILENLQIEREVLGDVNRAMNCDSANLRKLMDASDRQMENIARLLSHESFKSLSPSLQEVAKARIQAPDASLAELGQMLSPPLGKSGVNHRMRRLTKIAEQLPRSHEEVSSPIVPTSRLFDQPSSKKEIPP